jgi:hypothetical protein
MNLTNYKVEKTGFLHQDLACVALNQMIGGEDWHVESGACFCMSWYLQLRRDRAMIGLQY